MYLYIFNHKVFTEQAIVALNFNLSTQEAEDSVKFKDSLFYIVRPYLKKNGFLMFIEQLFFARFWKFRT